MKVGCAVVAAGRGTRAGLGYNKALYPLGGRSVLRRSLDALAESGLIHQIALVMNPDDEAVFREECARLGAPALLKIIVPGGATRRESAYHGLKALDADTDVALIHDAARPFVSAQIIQNVIDDAVRYGSGIISCPVTDTIKRIDERGEAVETVDRALLRSVQTPQAFSYSRIMQAHEEWPADAAATDDAYLYEKRWGSVHLTSAAGAEKNIKLTTGEDMLKAAARFAPRLRVGTGYDVHRLVEGRRLILCGVDVPHDKGLLGHSDADVALHALMDAMLGAAALGDIGKLFPDSDEQYRGISSIELLKRVNAALGERGYRLSNCDITIVCQKPKLAPHIMQMRQNIACALQTDVERISVKATTTERLGFEGEMLGISAQATALVETVGE